jgi:hypothetical protein
MAIRAKRVAAHEPTRGKIIKAVRTIVAEDDALLASKVVQIFQAANFRVVQKMRQGRLEMGDLLVEREELGRDRRYAVELKEKLNLRDANQLLQGFRNHVRTSKIPFREFDEFWVVANRVDKDARKISVENSRQFRILDIEELRSILAVARPSAGETSASGKARTKIGKAIVANEKEIVLAVASLMLQIEDKLTVLGAERPNSPEAITKRDGAVSEFERMQAELENIRTMVTQFKKNEVKETQVVKSVTTFSKGIRNWWNKDHDRICAKTYDMGLFATAVGVCSLAGAGGPMAVAISTALVGGKPVADAFKGIAKKFLT